MYDVFRVITLLLDISGYDTIISKNIHNRKIAQVNYIITRNKLPGSTNLRCKQVLCEILLVFYSSKRHVPNYFSLDTFSAEHFAWLLFVKMALVDLTKPLQDDVEIRETQLFSVVCLKNDSAIFDAKKEVKAAPDDDDDMFEDDDDLFADDDGEVSSLLFILSLAFQCYRDHSVVSCLQIAKQKSKNSAENNVKHMDKNGNRKFLLFEIFLINDVLSMSLLLRLQRNLKKSCILKQKHVEKPN